MIEVHFSSGHPAFDFAASAILTWIVAWRYWLIGMIAIVQVGLFVRDVLRGGRHTGGHRHRRARIAR